jgi:hypothetical protein
MVRLEKGPGVGRVIRRDDIGELARPTWTLIRESIRAGKVDEALALLDYCYSETKTLHDGLVSFVDYLLTYLGDFGEEEVYQALRKRYDPVVRRWLSDTPDLTGSLERCIEFQRGHGGKCTITEEPERYVVTCDPCGSGGQLRRTREIRVLKKAFFWTWGKKNIPHYCVHCCVMWEILPIELRGYPIRVNLIGDKPGDPCIHLYYKRPESIPEEYFTRIEKSKLY